MLHILSTATCTRVHLVLMTQDSSVRCQISYVKFQFNLMTTQLFICSKCMLDVQCVLTAELYSIYWYWFQTHRHLYCMVGEQIKLASDCQGYMLM